MTGLIERMKSAEDIQERINNWPSVKRIRACGDHTRLLAGMLSRARLENDCPDCGAVQDTSIHAKPCVECGSLNVCTPYDC